MLLLAVCADAQDVKVQAPTPRIDSNVVWYAPSDFRQIMDRRCDTLAAPAFQKCFIDLMRDMGASAEAVRFTSLTDTTGYVHHFTYTGRVDVAYVVYPFRANENLGVTLVNGTPPMIDVDDFQFVDLASLKKDTTYREIVSRFPDASVWPGDRFHFDQPKWKPLPGGGERFIVSYSIHNGCHACEHIGAAEFGFDFTEDGQFVGTHLIRVTSLVR